MTSTKTQEIGNYAVKDGSSSQKRKKMERPSTGKKPTRTSHRLKKKFKGKVATGERIEISSSESNEEISQDIVSILFS